VQKNLRKVTLAASALAFAALFSFSWSAQNGPSLSIGKAEARVGRPLTPMSVAGVARRNYRRAAVGTAVAVGATAGYYAGAGYAGEPYANGGYRVAQTGYYGSYASDTSSQPYSPVRAYYAGGPWYNYSGWADYAARNAISCTPGSMVRLDDGLMHVCQ
jgi:hypothetical protein